MSFTSLFGHEFAFFVHQPPANTNIHRLALDLRTHFASKWAWEWARDHGIHRLCHKTHGPEAVDFLQPRNSRLEGSGRASLGVTL